MLVMMIRDAMILAALVYSVIALCVAVIGASDDRSSFRLWAAASVLWAPMMVAAIVLVVIDAAILRRLR